MAPFHGEYQKLGLISVTVLLNRDVFFYISKIHYPYYNYVYIFKSGFNLWREIMDNKVDLPM